MHSERNICYASTIRVIYLVLLAYAEVKGIGSLRGGLLDHHTEGSGYHWDPSLERLLRWNC